VSLVADIRQKATLKKGVNSKQRFHFIHSLQRGRDGMRKRERGRTRVAPRRRGTSKRAREVDSCRRREAPRSAPGSAARRHRAPSSFFLHLVFQRHANEQTDTQGRRRLARLRHERDCSSASSSLLVARSSRRAVQASCVRAFACGGKKKTREKPSSSRVFGFVALALAGQ
jgi:hypothetical protein